MEERKRGRRKKEGKEKETNNKTIKTMIIKGEKYFLYTNKREYVLT